MKKISNFFAQLWIVFKTALKTFRAENYIRYSASLSYYTIFSIAPLLIITISLCGYFFGRQAMEGRIFSEIRSIVGDVGATQIQQMIQPNPTLAGKNILSKELFLLEYSASLVLYLSCH